MNFPSPARNATGHPASPLAMSPNQALAGHPPNCPASPPDHDAYDRWRDEFAVKDPFETDWIPAHSHGVITPPDEPIF